MGKKSKFSWVQFVIATPVGFALAFFLLPLSDAATVQMSLSGVVGLSFGLLAGRYGDDAWHALGSMW
jgi:hypothetical protein